MMTMRERMLTVVQGREHDRVPFCQYDDINAYADVEEMWDTLGRENIGSLRWVMLHRIETPNCRVESEEIEQDGLKGGRTILYTPEGQLTQVHLQEPAMGTAAIREHFVKEPEDYRALIALLRDSIVVEDLTALHEVVSIIGDHGLPHAAVPRTPYQSMWVSWVSLENLCVHMVDYPELVEECMSLLGSQLRQIFEIARRAPIPYVVIPDNLTAPAIGERFFRQYCLPYYRELSEMMAERDIPVYVHADGDLKPLWDAIGESGIRGLDSFSPPPDNDTRVSDVVRMWPEMRMAVNFPSSVHLAPPEKIREAADEILSEGGHTGRLWIQISENVPPGVWKKSYPAIIEAVNDFGKP